MYREPHLNKKNQECSALWYEWYDLRFVEKDLEKAKELRSRWSQCASELGELVHETLITDPRYADWKKQMRLDKIPDPRYNNSARVQEDEQSQT